MREIWIEGEELGSEIADALCKREVKNHPEVVSFLLEESVNTFLSEGVQGWDLFFEVGEMTHRAKALVEYNDQGEVVSVNLVPNESSGRKKSRTFKRGTLYQRKVDFTRENEPGDEGEPISLSARLAQLSLSLYEKQEE